MSATYLISVTPSIATATDHLLSIQGGGSMVRILNIFCQQSANATAVGLGSFTITRVSAVTASGGTAVTANPNDPADAAFSGTCQALPTTKGTAGVGLWSWRAIQRAALAANADAAPFVYPPQRLPDWAKDMAYDGSTATNGIAIINNTAVAGASMSIDVMIEVV